MSSVPKTWQYTLCFSCIFKGETAVLVIILWCMFTVQSRHTVNIRSLPSSKIQILKSQKKTQNRPNVWKILKIFERKFSKLKDNSSYQYFQGHQFSQEQVFFWKFMNFQLIHDRPRYQTWKCIGPPELVHFWMLLEES